MAKTPTVTITREQLYTAIRLTISASVGKVQSAETFTTAVATRLGLSP